jgi:hypothetical protein
MAALNLYLDRRIPDMPRGHINLLGSAYALSFIDVLAYWSELPGSVLQVIASDFTPLISASPAYAVERGRRPGGRLARVRQERGGGRRGQPLCRTAPRGLSARPVHDSPDRVPRHLRDRANGDDDGPGAERGAPHPGRRGARSGIDPPSDDRRPRRSGSGRFCAGLDDDSPRAASAHLAHVIETVARDLYAVAATAVRIERTCRRIPAERAIALEGGLMIEAGAAIACARRIADTSMIASSSPARSGGIWGPSTRIATMTCLMADSAARRATPSRSRPIRRISRRNGSSSRRAPWTRSPPAAPGWSSTPSVRSARPRPASSSRIRARATSTTIASKPPSRPTSRARARSRDVARWR